MIDKDNSISLVAWALRCACNLPLYGSHSKQCDARYECATSKENSES